VLTTAPLGGIAVTADDDGLTAQLGTAVHLDGRDELIEVHVQHPPAHTAHTPVLPGSSGLTYARAMAFDGWPAEAVEFYAGLEDDNSKSYWTSHKAVYEEKVLRPMTELVGAALAGVRRAEDLPPLPGHPIQCR